MSAQVASAEVASSFGDFANLSDLPACVRDDRLADLEESIRSSVGSASSLPLRIALAWHLRQRDTARAVGLIADVQRDLMPGAASLSGRCSLVLAEAAWLRADLEASAHLLQNARSAFERCGDSIGLSDTWALSAHIAIDQGRMADARHGMEQAAHIAIAAGDTVRGQAAEAVLANWSLLDDVGEADPERMSLVEALTTSDDPCVITWAHEYLGHLHARHGRHTQSLASFSTAYGQAISAGQVRRAIISCTNMAAGYSNLSDHDAALEWTERGLGLARRTDWPSTLGTCLTMLGNTLFLVDRLEPAKAALDEAIGVLGALMGSRALLVAKVYLVDVVLGLGDTAAAVLLAEGALRAAELSGLAGLRCDIRRALAHALLRDGQRERARDEAERTLVDAESQGSPTRCFDALLVLAEVYAPVDGGESRTGRRSLPHLLRALAVIESAEGVQVPVEVLDQTATEFALAGDAAQALALALRANAARDAEQSRAAIDRGLVLEARSQVARALDEAERFRQRTRLQMDQAELLRAANLTLELLGDLGRAITEKLQLQSIVEVLDTNFQHVMKASHVSIWLPDLDHGSLRLCGSLEGGTPLPDFSVATDSPISMVAHCFRSGEEILHRVAEGESGPQPMPGTLPMRWARFGPLKVHERILGVMSAQGRQPLLDSEMEHEQIVFGSLCNWVAIAVDNAQVCEQLVQARQDLERASIAEREARSAAEHAHKRKSAFLANISHDLRTPLASLHGYLETVALKLNDLSQAERLRYLGTASDQCRKVSRLADDLTELSGVESGKLPPRVQRCSLQSLVMDIFARLTLLALSRSQSLCANFSDDLPDAVGDGIAFERLISNLVENAILHAPEGSKIEVEVRALETCLEVTVADTGPGLPPELRQSLIAPPPRVVGIARPGGGGLGLLIVRHLLDQHGSRLRVDERPGFGAVLSFRLPVADGAL